ncbi:MAG: diguanylate cyclase [Oscillospiraceae bacterium]|nr:diguanylate cyclase [Oscillospiraceae bacterium]
MKQLLVEYRVGSSLPEQMAEVTGEIRTGHYRSVLIHVFSGIADEDSLVRLCRELRDCCGTELIVGSMSAGEIMDGHMIRQGILISTILFEESEIGILRFDDVSGNEVKTGLLVREALDAIPELKGAELMFPGTQMDTEHMFAQISRCREDIQIFGGYPGGHKLNSPEHFIFDASGTMYNSLLLITYAGKNLHFDMDKSIGWVPLGMAFKVTGADGKHLIELDGHPAAEVYERFLQIDRKEHDNAEEAFEFPVMARQNGEDRLRSVVHIEEDGSLWLHGFVKEGMDIHLTYGDPSNIVETVNERLAAMRQFRPQVVLLYSCVVRKTFWEDFVDMEMEPFAKICSTSGFHTWGEILRNTHTGELGENNITLLSIGMREGDAPEEELPPIRVDDTVLQGQASVLKRLTRLVYTTMDELQRAHSQLKLMAERDALTGLYNRGTIEQFINDALNSGQVVSLVMLDLDFFKKVNDRHGHDVGDMTLREITDIMRSSLRSYDGAAAGRWGGEEFFILLPGVDRNMSSIFAEHLRLTVDRHIFPVIGHQTISQGVITVCGNPDRKLMYKAVDDALYRAKEAGRNRVERAEL